MAKKKKDSKFIDDSVPDIWTVPEESGFVIEEIGSAGEELDADGDRVNQFSVVPEDDSVYIHVNKRLGENRDGDGQSERNFLIDPMYARRSALLRTSKVTDLGIRQPKVLFLGAFHEATEVSSIARIIVDIYKKRGYDVPVLDDVDELLERCKDSDTEQVYIEWGASGIYALRALAGIQELQDQGRLVNYLPVFVYGHKEMIASEFELIARFIGDGGSRGIVERVLTLEDLVLFIKGTQKA